MNACYKLQTQKNALYLCIYVSKIGHSEAQYIYIFFFFVFTYPFRIVIYKTMLNRGTGQGNDVIGTQTPNSPDVLFSPDILKGKFKETGRSVIFQHIFQKSFEITEIEFFPCCKRGNEVINVYSHGRILAH